MTGEHHPLKALFYIAERELEEKTKIEVQL